MPTLTLKQGMKQAISAKTPVKGQVYCPMCTHTVEANVMRSGHAERVIAGQKCGRCASSLDAGVVLHISRAA